MTGFISISTRNTLIHHNNERKPTNWKKYIYIDQRFVMGTQDGHMRVQKNVRMSASPLQMPSLVNI